MPKRAVAFIRVKKISGKEYGYLVENNWTSSGPRQKVAKYLGKVIRPQRVKSEDLGLFLGLTGSQGVNDWIGKSGFREIVAALVKWELRNHGTDADIGDFLDGKNKKAVVAINDGFLCGHTAKRLLEYDAAEDYSGYNLADALTAAGIAVDKDVFVSLFGKAQAIPKRQEEKTNAFKDFYY